MIIPPDSAEIFENENSKYWFDNGILYVISKKGKQLPLSEYKKRTDEFIEKMNGKKVCAIMDISDSTPMSPEAREHNQKTLPQIFKAIAFITRTALGRMLINLYLGLKPSPFPTKVFSNEKDALKWLSEYL
jgi:hypothetical protein